MKLGNVPLLLGGVLFTACVVDLGSNDDDSGSSEGDSSDEGSSDDGIDDEGVDNGVDASSSSDDAADTTGDSGPVPEGCEGLVGGGLTVHDGEVGDETWAAGRHRVASWITVTGRLEVQPCAIVELDPGTAITVRDTGALHMEGAADQPILVTSAKLDPAPGDWGGLEFYASSTDGDNVLRHVTIEYAGSTGYGSIWIEGGASVAIADSVIRDSSDVAIDADHGAELREFAGNELVDNAGAIRLGANEVDQLGAGVYGPNDEEGVFVEYDEVDHDAAWLALGVPYVADDGFRMRTETGSANLEIAAGVTLQLGPAAILGVDAKGGLHLAGTVDARVAVVSAKSPPAAGDWSQIEIDAASNGPANVFEHADIRHGGGGDYGQIWIDTDAELTLDDVVFEMSGDGCDIENHGTVSAPATTWVECT
jgi:hypothetical protein